jgi:hypothetical protein
MSLEQLPAGYALERHLSRKESGRCRCRKIIHPLPALEEAFARKGAAASAMFGTYTCAACGCDGLLAKEYGGAWYPESHDPPPRRRVNPSGKSGHYKTVSGDDRIKSGESE